MVTLHEVITFLVSMQISISSLQTHNVNRCGRSRHLARKLSLRRKRSSPNVFEMAATETITSIILIKLIRVSLRSEERFTGMPRPISYAVFCLKKKKEHSRSSARASPTTRGRVKDKPYSANKPQTEQAVENVALDAETRTQHAS